ncbi:MAG: ABC transporter permease [Bacilli bacterium]|nr:ABC transporter permease [Bacilli bacterium]MBR6225621.1 ABC transporter permease [Bacilli bacterium]
MAVLSSLPGVITLSVVFLFGCIGETISEKAGNLNLGIPGIMCFGVVGGTLGSLIYMRLIYPAMPVTANAFGFVEFISYALLILLGIVFSFAFGALGGLIYSFLTTTLKANQNVTGLAITTFGAGIGDFFMSLLRSGDGFDLCERVGKIYGFHFTNATLSDGGLIYDDANWHMGFISSNNPVANIFSQPSLVYICFILAIVVFIVLNKTRIGLSLRAVGENPATADAAGINTDKYRYLATIVGCGIAGIGGLFYLIKSQGSWDGTYELQSYGWMTLALVIFTIWNPLIAIAGSILFAFLYSIPSYLNVDMVTGMFLTLTPYIVTVVVLIFTSIFGKKNVLPPGSLGVNYFREER